MVTTFSWLHLSDFHQGLAGQDWIWPDVEAAFLEDLEKVHALSGPFDLVLFTGDLTQRGASTEYARFNDRLSRMWQKLAELGSTPVLMAVPGNHEVSRPDKKKADVKLLVSSWHTDRDIQSEFWSDENSGYRQVVEKAFEGYRVWWTTHPFPRSEQYHPGILPGDFSAVIQKEGARLGIVGLNSAFLQLTEEVKRGDLDMSVQQFHEACGGDGASFTSGCDVCLLLTHHPPEWLDKETLSQVMQSAIAPPGRFAVHLFGHMHESVSTTLTVNGAEPLRRWQAPALFGLEHYGRNKSVSGRRHGYAAGRIHMTDTAATLTQWPREAYQHKLGPWRFRAHHVAYDLVEGTEATAPEPLRRRRPPLPSAPVPPAHRRRTQRPDHPYDPQWYVHRTREETRARQLLAVPFKPVVLWGPRLYGKSTMLSHLLHQAHEESSSESLVVRIELSKWDKAEFATLDTVTRSMAKSIAAAGRQTELVPEIWARPNTASSKLTKLIEVILKGLRGEARLFLSIDNVDRLLPQSYLDEFSGMLRSWLGKKTTSRLRLLLALSTTPNRLNRSVMESPLANHVEPIQIPDFGPDQVRTLAGLHGVVCQTAEVDAILSWVGGHPYLVRVLLHQAATQRQPLRSLLQAEKTRDLLLASITEYLQDLPADLRDALRGLLDNPRQKLTQDVVERLIYAGLIVEGGYDFSRAIYRQYFASKRE